jgi:DsbC/DsbD-like thiol-disulfide interchange protein
MSILKSVILLSFTCARAAWSGEWSEPVEVRHDENLCLSYQARLDGPFLVVRAKIESGWHTFAMDNRQRAEEKLAGRRSLGIDHPTEILLSGGLEKMGPWFQTPPKDFSKPELRWFSWGFEQQALFATKVRRTPGATRITIRGQACTDTICKNIDVAIPLPPTGATDAEPSDVNLKTLVQVR